MDNQNKKINQKERYCNCCGRPIIKTAIEDHYMDYVHVEKVWGYFSSKDLTTHTFNICENCYDKWTASFAIPVETFPEDDIMLYSDEEMELLSAAYKKAGAL